MTRSLLLTTILGAGVTALCQPSSSGSTGSGTVEKKSQTCEASNSVAKLPSEWRAPSSVRHAASSGCDLPAQWRWNVQPFDQSQNFNGFKADLRTRSWDSPLVMNDVPNLRESADQRTKAEPIPTQWPNAKVEQIPTQWPQMKLQPVNSQSGSQFGASGVSQTPGR